MVLREYILGSEGVSRFASMCRTDAPEPFDKQILAYSTVAGSRLRATELYRFAELLGSTGFSLCLYATRVIRSYFDLRKALVVRRRAKEVSNWY
jgi:hypothetical protein